MISIGSSSLNLAVFGRIRPAPRLLLVVQTTIALSLTQVLVGFFKDANVPVAERLEVFQYFGTASRAMFTMFELTLATLKLY